MYLVHLALLHVVACLDIQIEGDLAIDLRVPMGKGGRYKWFRQGWDSGNQEKDELVLKMMQVRHNVTVAPEVECLYQYPEPKQINSVLSHMMNELTKVFVRANDFISGVETRRGRVKTRRKETMPEVKVDDKVEEKKEEKNVTQAPHRMEDSRFKVVGKKQKAFFELIYANMTKEYRNFYNSTAERVDRSGRDPCQHQDEVKQMWRDLLQHAQRTLAAAAQRCVADYLRDQRVPPRDHVRARLKQFLAKELAKVRAAQLDMLCDTYQLCYNDLL